MCRLGIFGFAFVLVGAITFGVFFPLSTVMSDVCVIANESIYSDTPRSDFLLDYILSCSEDSPITSINKYAVEALNKTSEMICDVLVEACNTTLPCGYDADNKEIIYCPLMTNCPTVECNLTTADTWANMSVKDYYIGCFDKNTGDFVQNSTGGTCPYNASASTREVCPGGNVVPGICNGNTTDSYPLGTCVDECKSEVFKDTSRSIVKYYDQYKKLVDIIENEILPLFNCVTVKGLLMDLMDYLCFGTMSSLKPITISVCAMAVLMLVATITGIVSIKRFNKKNRMNDRKDDTEMYSSGGGGNNDGGEVDNVYEDRKKPKEEEDYNGGGEVDNAYEDRRECEMEVFPDN